ncbi:MAG: septum formation initiator family protein [Desulfovermiculus sp.]
MYFRLILILLLAVNILLAWTILWGDRGIQPYRQQQQVLEEAESRLGQVREDNIELSRKVRLLKNNKAYLEQMIRTRLHYVQNNEVMYINQERAPQE